MDINKFNKAKEIQDNLTQLNRAIDAFDSKK